MATMQTKSKAKKKGLLKEYNPTPKGKNATLAQLLKHKEHVLKIDAHNAGVIAKMAKKAAVIAELHTHTSTKAKVKAKQYHEHLMSKPAAKAQKVSVKTASPYLFDF